MGNCKLWFVLFILLALNSCAVDMFLEYDNGVYWKKNGKFTRYGIYENQFTEDIQVSSDRKEITIGGLSKYNAPAWFRDTISTVTFIEETLSFPDGTILEKKITTVWHLS